MFLFNFGDELFVVRSIVFLVSIQILISSSESLYDHRIYSNTQWLAWQYIRMSKPLFRKNTVIEKTLNFLFNYPSVLLLFAFRLILALYLLFQVYTNTNPQLTVALILLITGLGFILSWRNTYSNNGADQLANIILIAVSISTLEGEGSVIKTLSIIFIACQSQLSYLTSGFFKFLEKDWRNGTSLKGIFSTEVFGHPLVKRIMDRRPLSYKIVSTAIIYGELTLGCSMFFPSRITLALLVAGAIFHFLTAVIMGLNGFFWVFVATYPSVYFLSLRIHA